MARFKNLLQCLVYCCRLGILGGNKTLIRDYYPESPTYLKNAREI